MSLLSQFENFRDSSKLVYNDHFIGDEGAKQLAKFIS